MIYDTMGGQPLDYAPCMYGMSNVQFRGPKRELDTAHIAFLGGIETYGRFLERPFPALLEERLGFPCVNFGLPNAGIDVFTQRKFLTDALHKASIAVVQVMGAQNMTNRFYSVHPRRNDRFVAPAAPLSALYPQMDFSDINFTRHLMKKLLRGSSKQFEAVMEEIQQAWVARMRLLLGQIKGKSVVVWFSAFEPLSVEEMREDLPRINPTFVTREMIDLIRPHADKVIEVVASPQAVRSGLYGMVFNDAERRAASKVLGPLAHEEAATALEQTLRKLI